MAAIPIPQQGDTDDPEQILRRTGAHAIPTSYAGNDTPMPSGGGAGAAIPTGAVGGSPSPASPAIPTTPAHHQAGVAALWGKAENIHNPVLRVLGKIGAGLARGIDVAGSIVAPGVAAAIPGSTLNNQIGENRQRKQAEEDTVNQERQATTAHTQAETGAIPAQTAHTQAETEALKNPQPAMKTGEDQTLHDLMTGQGGQPRINPDTAKPYSYLEAYEAVKGAAQKAGPVNEADKPLANRNQFNQTLARRFQVLHPGQTLPPEYTLPENATNGDYSRVNEALKSEEGAVGQQQQRQTSNADRQESRAQRQQEHAESRADRLQRQSEQDANKHQQERDKFVEPLQSAIDNADYQKAYAEGGQHTGTGDYQMMLQLQEAIVAGQKSGIRFNQSEQARIEHARSLMDSIGATVRHATVGTYFSDSQRKEIAQAMQAVAKQHKNSISRYDQEHGGGQQQAAPQTSGNEPTRPANVPSGYIYKENGPKGKGWYRP